MCKSEIEILQIAAIILEKERWWEKAHDATIVRKWRAEALHGRAAALQSSTAASAMVYADEIPKVLGLVIVCISAFEAHWRAAQPCITCRSIQTPAWVEVERQLCTTCLPQ